MQLPHICKMPVLLLVVAVVAVVVIGIAGVVVVAAASPYPGHMNNYVFALQQPQSMSMSMAMGGKSAFDRKVFIMFRVHSTRSGGSLQRVGAWQGRQGGRQEGASVGCRNYLRFSSFICRMHKRLCISSVCLTVSLSVCVSMCVCECVKCSVCVSMCLYVCV